MKESKGKLIAYWIITALVAANYLFAGYSYIGRNEQVIMGAKALGYPVYFFVMLGVWKTLGAIAILIPKTPVIKEWAYAGMLINLIGASVSCAVMGFPMQHVITPLVMLLFVIASWALRPASRRTEKMF
jgi:uncharacterized membrane protein